MAVANNKRILEMSEAQRSEWIEMADRGQSARRQQKSNACRRHQRVGAFFLPLYIGTNDIGVIPYSFFYRWLDIPAVDAFVVTDAVKTCARPGAQKNSSRQDKDEQK